MTPNQYKNKYPLNTFDGETQKELLAVIGKALKEQSEELIKRLEGEKAKREKAVDVVLAEENISMDEKVEINEHLILFNSGIDKAIKIIKGT